MTDPVQNVDSAEGTVTAVPWERVERFVGQLTHDVRNGLNALELQLTFLGEISTDPEAAAEVKLIRGTLADITRQLQAVRQATASVVVQRLDYPAAEFFEDLRERFERREPAAKGRVKWEVHVTEHLLAIDPEASLATFLELLENALRFGDANGTVLVTARLHASRVEVGIAHPLAQPPPLGVSDWGGAPLQSSQRSAYGLGLFRARRAVEAQGGTLDAAYSEQERTLTTRVVLPLTAKP